MVLCISFWFDCCCVFMLLLMILSLLYCLFWFKVGLLFLFCVKFGLFTLVCFVCLMVVWFDFCI